MNISSQMVRQEIRQGGAWRSFVPPGVRAIIQDRQLYGLSSSLEAPAGAMPRLTTGSTTRSTTLSTDQVILLVEAAVQRNLNTERYLHSRSTALHAVDLCRRFGVDPRDGYLAGIAHDFAKQMDSRRLIDIAEKAGFEITDLEKGKPTLLHGKVGAVLLREHLSIHNKDVLDAIASHTSGNSIMEPLAKIIYIADKTESTRHIDPAFRKMCKEADLDSLLYAVLEKTIVKLRAKKLELSEDTLLLMEKMKDR
jgi:nicotinate-nucleotide adenylyltransferase